MAEIFFFEGKANWEAKKNVNEFIRKCRDDLTVFGEDLDWDNWKWKGIVSFIKAGVNARSAKPEDCLSSDILPFAKAYVRYKQGHKPTKLKNEIKAIRCIEPSLIKVKGKADITKVDLIVLDEAVNVAKKVYKSTAYQAGNQLQHLANFLSENHMANLPDNWKHPISKPEEMNRTGKKWEKRRKEKMPSDYILNLMADLFSSDPKAPRDRYSTSTFALALCAPGRISEFQNLTVDCLHEEKDRDGNVRLGLRFNAGKGYGPDIKWISTPFVSIAKEAVRRLLELGREGRKLAKWLEEYPDRFFRHEKCPNVGDNETLTLKQVCDAMGWKLSEEQNSFAYLAKYFKDENFFENHQKRGHPITLRILNGFVHKKLPKNWPWKNKAYAIRYSNALFCMRKNELHPQRGASPVVIWTPDKNTLTFDLSPRPGVKYHQSLWDRHGYCDHNGEPIKITSHQFRHFLNTIAQEGDLGQLYIAKWSGRVSIGQNRAYNHISEKTILEKYKQIEGVADLLGPPEKVKKHLPATIEDLNEIMGCVAHVTEFGFCIHDFSMVPCLQHRDCLNCNEQICIKGDKEKLRRLKMLRKCIENEVRKCEKGIEEGYMGSDRWYEHQKRTLDRSNELIKLLESTDLKDGTIIQLHNEYGFSPLKREISANAKQKQLSNDKPPEDEIRALLGGGLG